MNATHHAEPRLPYTPHNVKIVHTGSTVTALYIPDPQQAKNPAHVLENLLDRSTYQDVEVVAEATRFYKSHGATFSGWIVRSGTAYTDPLPNKADAMNHLRSAVDDHFTKSTQAH